MMKQHVGIGESVIHMIDERLSEYFSFPVMKTAIDVIRGHHEKFDGSGYPYGMKGEEIPLAGRIVALADVFDALSSKRPYKEAYPISECLSIITEGMKKQFDPDVLESFIESMDSILKVYERYKEV